jgi:acetoin utilization protein AcuC
VSGGLAVAWSDELIGYDFGPGHPMRAVRLELTVALADELGLFARPGVSRLAVSAATDGQLGSVHTAGYRAAVSRAGAGGRPDTRSGLGSPDNPVFAGMHESAARVCGASLAAAEAVWTGRAAHGINVAGGLHHAMPDHASGFCVYNDPAVAIRWLLEAGAARVAYVDLDVHHGDGVQAVFFDDPRVLTISLHEDGRYLFPGTGSVTETGAGHTAVNVPLAPGTGDAGWLRAFQALVPALLEAFQPDVLVSQHGCDTHRLDPLAHLDLSLDGQRQAQQALHRLAHQVCGGRWLALGGGGYEAVQVVPRSWCQLLFEAADAPLAAGLATPASWRELVRERTGEAPPSAMDECGTGGWPWQSEPASAVEPVIAAVRRAVFPAHGLDPERTE